MTPALPLVLALLSPLTLVSACESGSLRGPERAQAAQEDSQAESVTERDPKAVSRALPSRDEVQKGCPRFGTPIVRFSVEPNGETKGHRFVRGTGCRDADKELIRWLKKWKYEPALRHGKPIKHVVTVVINLG